MFVRGPPRIYRVQSSIVVLVIPRAIPSFLLLLEKSRVPRVQDVSSLDCDWVVCTEYKCPI